MVWAFVMNEKWRVAVVAIVVFQWVQVWVFWSLMDTIRYQAEGSWLHETAWGPREFAWVVVVGLGATVLVLRSVRSPPNDHLVND